MSAFLASSPWSASPIGQAPTVRYVLAVGLFVAALSLRFVLLPVADWPPYITFYPAAIVAFYLCGTAPGVLVVMLGAVAGTVIFTPPQWSWTLTPPRLLSASAFVSIGALIGWVVHRLQATTRRLDATLSELRTSEQRYRGILEDQTEAISRLRQDGTLLYVNDAYCRMFGVTREAIIGSSWHPVALPEDVPGVDAKLATLSPANPVVVIENRVFGADGNVRWGQFVNRGFFDSDGRLVEIQSVGRDITERKAMEVRLVETTARVQDLYDNAPCGYCSIDAAGRFIHINAVALAWLGCTRDEAIGKLGPEDFSTAEGVELFRRAFPSLKVEGRVDGLEFDLVGRQGAIRRVSVSATAVVDAHGSFVMSRTVLHDITELHRARGELRRINREQAAMLDNDLVGIVKLRDRRVVWRNRAFDRMFGYEPRELLGESSRVLYPDDESFHAVGEAAYAIVDSGGQYRTQLPLRRKDGEPIWVDLSGVLLSDHESLWMLIDITSMREHQRRVEQMAFHDALTGLPNRLLLADRMRQALHLCGRLDAALAVCYVDLDRFKTINDDLGHDAGDKVLRAIADRLRHHVRANDTVSRIGGDEFVLLLAPLERQDECAAILERVMDSVNAPIPLPAGQAATISASIGVALYPRDADDASALIALADRAMYEAKRAGRNQVRYGEPVLERPRPVGP